MLSSAKEIPPGEEGSIDVTLKTAGRHGKLTKTITVTSNDPDNKNVQLKVSADIVVLFAFEPQRINLGRLKRQEIEPKILTATGAKLSDVNILSVVVDNHHHVDYYDIKLEDTGKGKNRQATLTITPTDAIPIGRFGDKIVVTAELDKVTTYDIYFTGEILGPIEVSPQALALRSASESDPLVGSISLKPTENTPFKVLEVTCNDKTAVVSVSEPDTEGTVTIDLALPVDFSGDRFQSQLLIKTDTAEQPEIRVPVHGRRNQPTRKPA